MSFVPDTSPGPRVLPKVFADVPSANELAEAKAEVAAARSSRNMLMLVVVLLLGMLIAAGVGLFYFEGQTRELPNRITELEEERAAAVAELEEMKSESEDLVKQYEEAFTPFLTLRELLAENDELRANAKEALKAKPKAAGLWKPPLGTEDSHTAFDDRSWPELKVSAEERLQAENKELKEITQKIQGWRPGPGPRPSILGD